MTLETCRPKQKAYISGSIACVFFKHIFANQKFSVSDSVCEMFLNANVILQIYK